MTNISVISYEEEDKNLKKLFLAARNCYNSKSFKDLNDSYNRKSAITLTKKLLNWKHMSVFEHINYTINLEGVSRSFLAQLTRHRVGLSLTVKSQHYIKHSNFEYKDLEGVNVSAKDLYEKTMKQIRLTYDLLINEHNVPHFIAREVLPNSTLCNVFMTVNLRELIHIFNLRLGKENTPEIRYVCRDILVVLKSLNPLLFNLLEDFYEWEFKIIEDAS